MNAVLVGVSANRNHFSFDAAIIVIFNAIMLMQPGIFTENLLKQAFTWNL